MGESSPSTQPDLVNTGSHCAPSPAFTALTDVWQVESSLEDEVVFFSQHGPDPLAVDGWEASPEICYL